MATAMVGRELALAAAISEGVSPTTHTLAPVPAKLPRGQRLRDHLGAQKMAIAEAAKSEPVA